MAGAGRVCPDAFGELATKQFAAEQASVFTVAPVLSTPICNPGCRSYESPGLLDGPVSIHLIMQSPARLWVSGSSFRRPYQAPSFVRHIPPAPDVSAPSIDVADCPVVNHKGQPVPERFCFHEWASSHHFSSAVDEPYIAEVIVGRNGSATLRIGFGRTEFGRNHETALGIDVAPFVVDPRRRQPPTELRATLE